MLIQTLSFQNCKQHAHSRLAIRLMICYSANFSARNWLNKQSRKRFTINQQTRNIRMTYEYIRVMYGWHTSTYGWHTSTYEWHTDDIRMKYEWHTSTYEWHTSDIRMTCKIILNCIQYLKLLDCSFQYLYW